MLKKYMYVTYKNEETGPYYSGCHVAVKKSLSSQVVTFLLHFCVHTFLIKHALVLNMDKTFIYCRALSNHHSINQSTNLREHYKKVRGLYLDVEGYDLSLSQAANNGKTSNLFTNISKSKYFISSRTLRGKN